MTVEINFKDGSGYESFSNGEFAAMVIVARAFGENVPAWNGCHDGQEWTPEHLKLIAARIRQMYKHVEILEDAAAHGGITIS